MFGGNPAFQRSNRRLDDLWSLQLDRRTSNDVLNLCRTRLHKQRIREMYLFPILSHFSLSHNFLYSLSLFLSLSLSLCIRCARGQSLEALQDIRDLVSCGGKRKIKSEGREEEILREEVNGNFEVGFLIFLFFRNFPFRFK